MSPSDFPDWVIWRFEELVEEGELEVERRREELRGWAYWIYIEGFERAKVNTAWAH